MQSRVQIHSKTGYALIFLCKGIHLDSDVSVNPDLCNSLFLFSHCLCSLNHQMNNNGNKRAPTTATQRLKQDYLRIKKDPVPYICAEPLPSNILEW